MPNVGDVDVMAAHGWDGARASVLVEYEVTAVDVDGVTTAIEPLRWAYVDDRPAGRRAEHPPRSQVPLRDQDRSPARNELVWRVIGVGVRGQWTHAWLALT